MFEFVVQGLVLAFSLVILAGASHFTIGKVEDLIALTGLSEISAGFAILAVMTSIPEIGVAAFSVFEGTPGISAGDILGSNIFNIAVVLGVIGMFGYLKNCCTKLLLELTDVLFLTSLIPLLLVIFNVASPFVGMLLLGIFVFSMYMISKKKAPPVEQEAQPVRKNKLLVILMVFAGIAVVLFSSRLVVSSAYQIAVGTGIAPITVGAKIVAIGTSLPELSLSLIAARRGRVLLVIGDVIGSNLTNLTLVLGLLLVASPFAVNINIFAEILPFVLVTTLILWRYLTKGTISQVGGLVLLMTYILFQAILQ